MTDSKILLTRLHQYRTRDGREYLRGYLAETKILVFADDRAELPPGVSVESAGPSGAKTHTGNSRRVLFLVRKI